MSKDNDTLLDPVIAVPLGLKQHFDNPVSSVHHPLPGFQYIDPSHPGHDYFNDPEPKKGLIARILRR